MFPGKSRHAVTKILITGAFFILVALASSPSLSGQERIKQPAPPLRERMFFGGSFGLQFGTITNIQVAPIVGLWVLPRISVAVGPEYMYYHDPYTSTNTYGAKFYAQFVLVQNLGSVLPVGANTGIFLHFEDEFVNLDPDVWQGYYSSGKRANVNTILGGAGISQGIGRRAAINLMFLWVLDDGGFPYMYSNPEIRISFTF